MNNTEKTQETTNKDLRVVLVEPGKPARVKMLGSDLHSLQEAVGGDIQAVYPFNDLVALVCNEEGKLLDLPLNRALRDPVDGSVYDIISGTFFICGLVESDFASLPDNLVETFLKKYRVPERFVKVCGRICVLGGEER